MAFNSRVYRILIASPSDVHAERDAAVQAIQEWNNLNSAQRAATLLPIRWETHATPAMGERPQGIINRQIVDDCDALIGVFWTRFGSPTGIADSGTLEEIERTVNAGKPAMLYFSSAPQMPDAIDTAQLDKLREFKRRIQNTGLIQSYNSLSDFKDHLARHLEQQVRSLLSSESTGTVPLSSTTASADIRIRFDQEAMQIDDVSEDGHTGQVKTTFTLVDDPSAIPDYISPSTTLEKPAPLPFPSLLGGVSDNRNYYRDVAAALQSNAFRKLCFEIRNVGSIGARDVFLEIEVSADEPISVVNASEVMREVPSRTQSWSARSSRLLHAAERSWALQYEIGAVQPQRLIHWTEDIFIAAWTDCDVRINVAIYADIFPEPIKQSLTLNWICRKSLVRAGDLVIAVQHPPSNEGNRDAPAA